MSLFGDYRTTNIEFNVSTTFEVLFLTIWSRNVDVPVDNKRAWTIAKISIRTGIRSFFSLDVYRSFSILELVSVAIRMILI